MSVKIMRNLNKNPGPVPCFRVGPDSSSVAHMLKNLQSFAHDLISPFTGNIADKSHPAAIMLKSRII
jgi:hypothetical protein